MSATKTPSRNEVLSVIRDGSRIDRYLECGADGWHFTPWSKFSDDQFKVEPHLDSTEEDECEAADALITGMEQSTNVDELHSVLETL